MGPLGPDRGLGAVPWEHQDVGSQGREEPILEPDVAVLDETDSGLDIDALRIVASGVKQVQQDRPDLGVLLITHYQRILDELTPDRVHILVDGRIVDSGGPDLARRLEQEGYDAWRG